MLALTIPQESCRLGSMKTQVQEQPEQRPRGEVVVLNNPATGKPYSQAGMEVSQKYKITPKIEQAIRLYAVGQVASPKAAAALAGCSEARFSLVFNSPGGQAIVSSVRGDLDFRYQGLYKKFIDVVDEAMSHPEPSVALAGASLFAKTQIGTKTKVELSAEDIVQQILQGTYVRD